MRVIKSLLVLLCLSLYSCGPNVLLDETRDIEIAWKYDDVKTFEFDVKDSTQVYDMLLLPSHANDFGYENLYIKVETTFPTGDTTSHIVSLNLGDNMGSWVGTCRSGYCEPEILLKNDTRFLEGTYRISISQYSREEHLQGVRNLRLKVVESGK